MKAQSVFLPDCGHVQYSHHTMSHLFPFWSIPLLIAVSIQALQRHHPNQYHPQEDTFFFCSGQEIHRATRKSGLNKNDTRPLSLKKIRDKVMPRLLDSVSFSFFLFPEHLLRHMNHYISYLNEEISLFLVLPFHPGSLLLLKRLRFVALGEG